MRRWDDVPLADRGQWPGKFQVYQANGGGEIPFIFGCSLAQIEALPCRPHNRITALLVDSTRSGSGETWDWKRPSPEWTSPLPLILAGGLNPSNVRRAIQRVHPLAVDVSSGVELAPGIKDFTLVKSFIDQAQSTALAFNESSPPWNRASFQNL